MSDSPAVFEIDGEQYEWPGFMGFTLRELQIFYAETGRTWESLMLEDLTVRRDVQRAGVPRRRWRRSRMCVSTPMSLTRSCGR